MSGEDEKIDGKKVGARAEGVMARSPHSLVGRASWVASVAI